MKPGGLDKTQWAVENRPDYLSYAEEHMVCSLVSLLLEASCTALISVCSHAFSSHLDNYWLFLLSCFVLFFTLGVRGRIHCDALYIVSVYRRLLIAWNTWHILWCLFLIWLVFTFKKHVGYTGDQKHIGTAGINGLVSFTINMRTLLN